MRQSRLLIQLSDDEETAFLHNRLSRNRKSGILVLSDEAALERYKEALGTVRIKQLYLFNRGDAKRESRKFEKGYQLIGITPSRLIDHIRRDQIDLTPFRTLLVRLPGKKNELFLGDISFIMSHMVNMRRLFIFGKPSPEIMNHPLLKTVETPKKTAIMKKENCVAKIPENMINAIDDLVRKTKSDNEPEKLADYRKIFKKCVPMGFRGWVTAYLLKEYLSKDKSLKMPQLQEGATLFIGIGKNRKVYPKDLIHLFINTGKIERNHIGEIRILDNYSFVTIEKESSEKAIDNLNGINYRGRNLTVNFAKQK